MLENAANLLNSVSDEVKIVINKSQIEKFSLNFPGLDFVFDIFEQRGAPGGVHAALRNSTNVWTFVLACDLPLVTEKAIKTLANIAAGSSENVHAVVPRQFDGKLQPLCAVYRAAACLPKIEELFKQSSSNSMLDFLASVSVRIVETAQLEAAEKLENLFFNINQPPDFQKIESGEFN